MIAAFRFARSLLPALGAAALGALLLAMTAAAPPRTAHASAPLAALGAPLALPAVFAQPAATATDALPAAAPVVTAPKAPGLDWTQVILGIAGLLITGLALPILTLLVKNLPQWTEQAKTATLIKQSELANTLKNRALDILRLLFLEALQVAVEDIKAQAAKGALDPAQTAALLAKVKDDVLAKWQAHLSAEGILDALAVLMGGQPGVRAWGSTAVEALVASSKVPAVAPVPVVPSLPAPGSPT